MARPSSKDIRERIDLERVRNADLVDAAPDGGANRMAITLAILDAIAKWWHDESVRLETSSKRTDVTNRKEYRVASRQAEAIAASIRQHGCAGDEAPGETAPGEPTPAGSGDGAQILRPGDVAKAIAETLGAVPSLDAATAALEASSGHKICGASNGTHICSRYPHAVGERHATRDGIVFVVEPETNGVVMPDSTDHNPPIGTAAEIAAYISGDADMPTALALPRAPGPAPLEPQKESAPVQPSVTFADPAPVLVDLDAVATSIPTPGADLAHDLAAPGLPAIGPLFADPAPAGARGRPGSGVMTFADLMSAPAGAPLDHRSISQVQTFADCGLKYRLQRRESVSQQPQWTIVGGKALHSAIEEIERFYDAAPVDNWPDAISTYDLGALWLTHFNRQISETIQANPDWPMGGWRASARGAEGFTWWMGEGADMLRQYVAWRTEWDREWVIARVANGVPLIEYGFVLNVDGTPVKGVIDQVWSHRATGRLTIVDAKSGSKKPDDDFQLRTYGYALMYIAGMPTLDIADSCSGAYFDARKGRLSEPVRVITPNGWEELSYRFRAMDAADRAGIHMPRPSSFCGGCSVKHACPLRAY